MSAKLTKEQKKIAKANEEKLVRENLEKNVLELNGMKKNLDFVVDDVEATWNGNTYLVHTFQGGFQNKDVLVLFHGYGGSNVHYGRVYPALCSKFRVYSIDLPGMGFSSKENIQVATLAEVESFFMGVLESWRQALGLEEFSLAGHSFGGYIASLFALACGRRIKHLFLLSPAGSTTYTETEIQQLNQQLDDQPWYRKMFIKYAECQWKHQATPQKVVDKWYGKFLLGRYLSKRMRLQGPELDAWKKYKEAMIALPEGSEKALFVLFKFPKVIPKISIQKLFTDNASLIKDVPVLFLFGGENDWMDKKGAQDLSQQFKSVRVELIPQAGHQLQLENPDGVALAILQDFDRRRVAEQEKVIVQFEEKLQI